MSVASLLRPLSSRVLGKLGASRSLEQAAANVWELGPAVDAVAAPARVDDADLAKATAAPNGRTIEHNVALARGGPITHMATRAYELRDAALASGHVFAPGFFMPLGKRPVPWTARAPERRFDRALLTTTPYGVTYFGHWLVECLPLAMLAKQRGETALSTIAEPSANQRQYLDLLGLQEHTALDAAVDHLVVVEDIGQNDHKLARYHAMRQAARRALGPGHKASRGVFFVRGASGERRVLVNESELAGIAARHGLEVVKPLESPARRLVEASLDAPVIVGVEGSQLLNGFPWLAPGGTMLALMPPQRFDLILKGPCDALEATFSILIGDERGDTDFHVDPIAFERRLDEHLTQGVRPAPRFDAVASAQPST